MSEKEPTPRERVKRAEKNLNTNVFGKPVSPERQTGYSKGGKVKTKSGKVHKGEFVVRKSAANAIGTKRLNKLNRRRKK